MIFNKSATFGNEEIGEVGIATPSNTVRSAGESDFIERLKAHDEAAFDTLVTRYTPVIYGLLLKITGDTEEANDLTQETFIRALKSIKSFRGDSEIKTWLYRIAVNQSKNRFRWWKVRKRHKTSSLDAPIGESELSIHETLPANGLDPEENTLSAERESLIFRELDNLPDIFKESVLLCDVEGLSYEEISAVLEISIGTVKSRISRGRKILRTRLSDV